MPPVNPQDAAETKSRPELDPWGSVLLFLSGMLLWGPFALALLTFSLASFGSTGMAGVGVISLADSMFTFILDCAFAGALLLAVYVVVQKPWREGALSFLFVLQLLSLGEVAAVASKEGVSIFDPAKDLATYAIDLLDQWRDASPQFMQALGAPPPETDQPRHPSDVAAARKLFASSALLRRTLHDHGGMLCELAQYTDPQGLQFLRTEVWPGPQPPCPLADAAEAAITHQNHATAAWLVDQVDVAELPRLAALLIASSNESSSANPDADRAAYQASALPVLERMLQRGLRADSRPNDTSLLSNAARRGEDRIAAVLLAHSADPNEILDDRTPLLQVAIGKGPALARAFLTAPGLRLDARDDDGRSALDVALAGEKVETVAALLDAGVSLDGLSRKLAAVRNPQLMRLLLDRGADPRWRDQDGNTLLAYMYIGPQFPQLASMLVKAGLLLNARNRHGATILNYLGDDDAVERDARKALIDLGAEPGKDDRRLTVTYTGSTQAAAAVEYTIRLQNGQKIAGRTDVFGKTDWVPDGSRYEIELTRVAL